MIIMVLIDGLADLSIPELGNKTPLEAAHTPTLDALAAGGLNGLLDPVEPGLACGSDTAHLSILGYPPHKYYRGRGAFEAMGAGLSMDKRDVAFKCNFATIDSANNTVIKRRVDRNFSDWGTSLCPFLDGTTLEAFPEIKISVKYATEHRCGIVLRGPGLTDAITGTDPLKDNLPLCESGPLNDSPSASYSSRVLNEVSRVFHEKLTAHPINVARVEKGLAPANIVLLRGPGERLQVPSFAAKHGMKAFMIAPTCIIAGIGISLGFDLVNAKGATGDHRTNLISKADTAIRLIKANEYDFGFLHIKAVDDAGHDKNLERKVHLIEQIDLMLKHFLCKLQENFDNAVLSDIGIIVTGDHSTPVSLGDHSFEPVPFTICSALNALHPNSTVGNRTDNVTRFCENEVGKGFLGRFPGREVKNIMKAF